MKTIKIKTELRKFFHQWVQIVSPLLQISKTEKIVLAEFYYYRYMLMQEVTDINKVHRLLFDYTMKTTISNNLGITTKRLANVLVRFRSRGIIREKIFNEKKSINSCL